MSKSKETATENVEVLDTYKENMLRTIDEISKYQPKYAQAISNLQQDYLQVTKDTITKTFAIQKSLYGKQRNAYFPTVPSPYAENYRKQSEEFTSQAFHVFDTSNQLAIDSLNASRENIKLYSKTVETVIEYNAKMADTWSNYFTSAQKQYSNR